ncbi:MAG: ABC transporter ATP-binding protein [Chloroflexota bacterium]|nr:MAG: ABC transporter ATP-binding protein [Chloroflexota bacterium]
MTHALQAIDLGKRYGRQWALQDCSLTLPKGRVAALVGPNGAGKTTLLHLAVGLAVPSSGHIEVFGWSPRRQATLVLPRAGFVAQDHPLYRNFTVHEMLGMGRRLNPHWDDDMARGRLKRLGIPIERKVGKLSGGQQAQVALVMTLAKRPELVLLDEPLAALDPLARREFLRTLMEAVAEDGLTVLLSSHIIAELERVCDYLIILSSSRVQLTGDIEELAAKHKLLVGPRRDEDAVAHVHNVVQVSHTERQTTLLVRLNGHIFDSSWEVHDVPLEEIVLAYLGRPAYQAWEVPERDTEEVPA